MARSKTPLIDLIRDTWPLFMSNLTVTVGVPAFLIGAPFLCVVVPTCVLMLIIGFAFGWINKGLIYVSMAPVGIIGILLFAVVYGAIRAGWTNILLRMMRGQPCVFRDFASGMPWLFKFVLTMFMIGVGTALGSIFFVIPGILFAVRTSLAPFLVIDKNLSPIEAILKSNELVSGYSWQIFGYLALLHFTNMVAHVILIGNIVLVPASMGFFDLVLARIYFALIDEDVVQ